MPLLYCASRRSACSTTWRAYERNLVPSSVGTTPRLERSKMVMPISPSSSERALDRLGCAM